jgi:Secretion system C-terminal sorting domain
MKKIILCIAFIVLGAITKVQAQIILTTDLDLDPNSSSKNITAYPNSTAYPGYYELNMRLSVMVNTFQIGKFSTTSYKRTRFWNNTTQTYGAWGTWGAFVPNMNVFPNLGPNQTPASSYTGTARTYQLQGTQTEYYVRVTFVANNGGGTKTQDTPTRTATILGVPTACFSLYNVSSTQTEPSIYGPQVVNNVCQFAVAMNGSCSQFETGYHVRVSEFNLATWTFVDDLYDGWVSGSGEAPSYISLNALVAANGKSFTPGKLYFVNLSVGSPWNSASGKFIRIQNCRQSASEDLLDEAPVEVPSNAFVDETVQEIKLFPNPVKDEMTITVNEVENIISYTLFDNSGNEVKRSDFLTESNEQKVNLTGLRQGIYLINIVTDKQTYREKIIKE